MIKGQDIIILLLIRLHPEVSWTHAAISQATGLSLSQCHLSLNRLRESGLLSKGMSASWNAPEARFIEFIIHGFKYVFPPKIGMRARGIPTAHSAPFLADTFRNSNTQDYVWPDPQGTHKGNSLEPIHPCQLRFVRGKPTMESLKNREMYELLVCLDLLRIGGARERNWAAETIKGKIHGPDPQ